MALLQVEDLIVRFPSRAQGILTVLDGITLAVAKGEFFSLIGPSGCGKTTLLRVLNGLIEPSAGHITRPAATMAMVFQKPTLMPWRTVIDNAIFGLECRGRVGTSARTAAAELLERMRLGDHLHDYAHELSEGMKQRVNLARALLVAPDILLLDEPFAALDVMTRRALQDDLIELWQERHLTIVLVSHSLEEVCYLSDRVGVLSDKPTRLIDMVAIDLPRPRCQDPEATLAMLQRVQELEGVMRQPG